MLGVVGGFYSQRIAVQTANANRREARRIDLRETLASAATVAMTVNLTESHADTTLREVGHEAARITHNMERCRGELGVRLGPDAAAYEAYEEVQRVMLALAYTFSAADPAVTLAQLNDRENQDPSLKSLRRANADCESALATYLAEAEKVVGALMDTGAGRRRLSLPR